MRFVDSGDQNRRTLVHSTPPYIPEHAERVKESDDVDQGNRMKDFGFARGKVSRVGRYIYMRLPFDADRTVSEKKIRIMSAIFFDLKCLIL